MAPPLLHRHHHRCGILQRRVEHALLFANRLNSPDIRGDALHSVTQPPEICLVPCPYLRRLPESFSEQLGQMRWLILLDYTNKSRPD
jgi:hypothetical protein